MQDVGAPCIYREVQQGTERVGVDMERQNTGSIQFPDGDETTGRTLLESEMCEKYPVLRDLLSPKLNEFGNLEVRPQGREVGLIRQLVDDGVPVDFSIERWNFLHTVCLLGSVELLEFLLHGLKEKDEELCRQFLNRGYFPYSFTFADLCNGPNVGTTPLHCAILNDTRSESVKICQMLLDHGASVYARDEDGSTPLHVACQNQSEYTREICRQLLDHGADVLVKAGDVYYDGTYTPMHMACLFQTRFTKEICRLLLEHGANVNEKSYYTHTVPLRLICVNQSEFSKEICKLLLDYGAEVNAKEANGNTLLNCACSCQSEFAKEICKLLLDHGANVNADSNNDFAPLSRAFQNPSKFTKEICKLLLDHGADVSTSLYTACTYQSEFTEEICKLLLDHGVDACTKNGGDRRYTPLHCACKNQSEFTNKTCKVLLDHGADANAREGNGNTPLHCVLKNVSCFSRPEVVKEVCQLLLVHGADINSRNREGETPIICCVKSGLARSEFSQIHSTANVEQTNLGTQVSGHSYTTVDMCEWLIKSGSDVDIRMCKDSQTIYHVIAQYYLCTVVLEIRSECSREQLKIPTVVHEILTFFTNNHEGRVTINSRDEEGNSPLHTAVKPVPLDKLQELNSRQRQKLNMLTLSLLDSLISCGSKVNAVNDRQQTPLHLAPNGFVIKSLLRSGAEPNARDENGNTPLMIWASSGDDGKLQSSCFSSGDMLEYFEQGVNPFVANIKGDTVLDVLLSGEKFVCAKNFIRAVVAKDSQNAGRKDASGNTFLHVLCKCSDDRVQEMIELLLKVGADPNCLNLVKDTPMHVLCKKHAALAEQTVEHSMTTVSAWAIGVLKKYGADPDILDGNDKTCLDIAKDNNLNDLHQLLEVPVELIEIPPLLPWEQKSNKHRSVLGQVARHQKSKQIEMIHYHCQPIGSGAFGHVHVGINEKDGQEIAVKRIELLRLHRPEDKREIKNLLCLRDCEQVVKYHSYCKDEHFLYIILELMDGSLDELICPEGNHVKLCMDVVTGLAFLHVSKVLHRDIKPGNILYKTQPRLYLKLADFGLSAKASFSATIATCSVMHSKAGTRCWMAAEIHKTTEHSEASDVFSTGLVLHHILAEKKHAFGPKDEMGMNDAKIQVETEMNIMNGKLNLSDIISPEARHLLHLMLQYKKEERPTAAVCLKHPFFWSKKKKKEFLYAVGNQPEFQEPRHVASAQGLSSVELDIEATLGPEFTSNPWEAKIQQIYMEMVLTPRSRRYDTTSAVDLVRLVRNSYAHVSDATRPTGFQVELLNKFVYLDKFPTLFITVYQAVMKYVWSGREEIKCVVEESKY